jgi:hypothetical protein
MEQIAIGSTALTYYWIKTFKETAVRSQSYEEIDRDSRVLFQKISFL